MVKKFSAILFALVLCAWTTPVHAAPTELPLSLSNSWAIAKDGGDCSYTIPYTGNYEISLSGSQGSAYSNNYGGYGYKLTKNIRLTYGDTIKISTPNRPTGYTTANGVLTVPAGNDASIYVNDKLVWSAGGGS